MDSFVPPGYVSLAEVVQLAGQALLKDEWLGATSMAAEQGLQQEVLAIRRRRPQYEQVIAHIRTAFCTGEISAGRLELLTGRIVEIPADFWRSPVAEAVFIARTPWIVPEPDSDHIGQVLLVRADVEAWLAKQDQPDPQARKLAAAEVKEWLAEQAKAGEFWGADAMWKELQAERNGRFSRDRFYELRDSAIADHGVTTRPRGARSKGNCPKKRTG